MGGILPLWLVEPESREKRNLTARKLFDFSRKTILTSPPPDLAELKQRLKEIREYSRQNINSLLEEFKTNLSRKYPQVAVKFAAGSAEAVEYISQIAEGIEVVSTNKSGVVREELEPGLRARGFTVINSYWEEFEIKEGKIRDYWDLPRLLDKSLSGNFEVSKKITDLAQLKDAEVKRYLAVLGVNAVSAEDCTVFFLQHFSNIYRDLQQAKKVVLVVGLDKIVKDREEAAFQTKCMGIFGLESMLLGIRPKSGKVSSPSELPSLPKAEPREFHLIILDNGRTELLQSKFKDLFLCIGCRACVTHCPIAHFFLDEDYTWSGKNYLARFLRGESNSIDLCLHCEACRLECPLELDLPHLMWEAKLDYLAEHGRPWSHRILGRPELLAKLGTLFAPLSNRLVGINSVRVLMEFITGIDRRTDLPRFHFQTFRKWFKKHG